MLLQNKQEMNKSCYTTDKINKKSAKNLYENRGIKMSSEENKERKREGLFGHRRRAVRMRTRNL